MEDSESPPFFGYSFPPREPSAGLEMQIHLVFGHPLTTTGVVQPVALYRPRPGTFRVLRITPETPRSDLDQFSLMVSRARADAIITTGQNLRLEPTGTHEIQGSGTLPQALSAWRRETLAKTSPPHLLVLSRGKDLDLDHPAFKYRGRVFLFTSEESAFALEAAAAERGIEVVGAAEPSPAEAVEFLRQELGAATISVEAGPSVSRQLYDPVIVDEIQLSIFDPPDPAALPGSIRGPFFLDEARLRELYRWSPGFSETTADGRWTFYRLERRADY